MPDPITYAVGDIHGELGLLRALVDSIEADARGEGRAARVVFLGDYVDRGPDSRGVIEFLMAGPGRPGDTWIALRGNHDDMLLECFRKDGDREWLGHFAKATLGSYGLPRYVGGRPPAPTADLDRHLDWIATLPYVVEDPGRLFVHAGVMPGAPLSRHKPMHLMWMREGFTDNDAVLDWQVVHGHTIVGPLPRVGPYRVSIDTGAFKNGRLTCAVFDGDLKRFLQARKTEAGRIEVSPVRPA